MQITNCEIDLRQRSVTFVLVVTQTAIAIDQNTPTELVFLKHLSRIMIVRVANELVELNIGDGEGKCQAKELVSSQDNMGYVVYEFKLKAGEQYSLVCTSSGHNHIYLCLAGKCKVTVGDDKVTVAKFQLLAMASTTTGYMTAEEPSRFLFCSVAEDPSQSPKPYIVRSLDEMIGTERDVDYHHGRSRRYLVKRDGYNISTHNTLCYANLVSPMAYVNQLESCYYIQGHGKYTWNERNKTHEFDFAKHDGTMFVMDKHDSHEMCIGSEDVINITFFYPPLKGHETHDFSTGVSSYE